MTEIESPHMATTVILPPLSDKPGGKPFTVYVVGGFAGLLLALASATFALLSVSASRDDLQRALQCRSASAIIVDEKVAADLASIGEGLAVNGESQATTLSALLAIQLNDDSALAEAVSRVPDVVESLKKTAAAMSASSSALAAAIDSRKVALDKC